MPVLVDPTAECRRALRPAVVVDAIVAKRNTGTSRTDAPLVIALGPGFTAGRDCHAVIETNRGHWLGRALWTGSAQPDTTVPGEVSGRQGERVLRAPMAGVVEAHREVGDRVAEGELVASVNGIPVYAPFAGVLRGLIHPGLCVPAGLKIGDLDPRGERDHCVTISDKSLAIAGGVLEAILATREETR
jgi:xanthine dehydrogenase accessory factor